MKLYLKVLAVGILLLAAGPVLAQKASRTIAVNFSILATTTLTVTVFDHDETNAITFTKADAAPLGAVDFGSIGLVKDSYAGLAFGEHIIGGSTAHALEFTVTTNDGAWTLRTRGSGDFTSGLNTVPLGRLSWALNDGVIWIPYTTLNTTITTGVNTNGTAVNLDMKVRLDAADVVAVGYTTNTIYEVI